MTVFIVYDGGVAEHSVPADFSSSFLLFPFLEFILNKLLIAYTVCMCVCAFCTPLRITCCYIVICTNPREENASGSIILEFAARYLARTD